jgi:hypothetical protein
LSKSGIFSVEVKGADHLDQMLSLITDNLPGAVEVGMEKALNDTGISAMRLAPGPVKKSIRYEILGSSGDTITGRVFTDTSITAFAPYVEFGTGIKVDNEGVDDAIRLKRAKKIPWYIHVSMVPASFAKYGYPLVVGMNGEKYWEVDGMYPRPYLKPAAFQNREKSAQTIAETIGDMIREASGYESV